MGIVTEKLRSTPSRIYLPFDFWMFPQPTCALGVNCYFADKFGDLTTFLLALPEQLGPHASVDIADNITAIIPSVR